jgi:hypothetical protein
VTLGQRSQGALDDFLAHANSRALHPLDTQRWNVFIIAVKLDGATVDYLALSERLISETELDEETTDGLLGSLTSGLELLKLWEDRQVDRPT